MLTEGREIVMIVTNTTLPPIMLTETTMMMVCIETTSFTNVPTAGWDCSLNDGYTAAQCAYHPPFDSQDDEDDEYYGHNTHVVGVRSLSAIKRILSSDGSHPPCFNKGQMSSK